jgi:hypothetical protein
MGHSGPRRLGWPSVAAWAAKGFGAEANENIEILFINQIVLI